MPASPQSASVYELNKIPQCQRGQKLHLNMHWPKPSHASEDKKCISKCVGKNQPMPARTENASQHVLTKCLPYQRRHKMHLSLCWPNPSHASEYTKFTLTCVDKNNPIQTRTHYESQHVLTKHIPCQRVHKIYLYMWWPNPSHASEDTKWI